MKKLLIGLALCGAMTIAVAAQTPPPPPRTNAPAGAAATTPAGGLGAEGKIAILFYGAFREGIGEMKAKLDTLNAEFEPKNKEIQSLRERIENLNAQIRTQGGTVQPAVRNQWAEEAAEKDKQLKRLAEDTDAMAKKRFEEVAGPIQEKIFKFLEQYSQQRGIVMVLEGSALQQTGVILFASQATNITEDFMKEYNKAYPAATSGPTTSRK
ncbi:MAG: OmpH family outer membrane protein [Acidobacteria bacterium]|nr:OmpH family outer membrane protein [Acidobacteriota bacterium]MCW5967559.1 OmpH family outer membrane protein [Blastocatellales bacterium]